MPQRLLDLARRVRDMGDPLDTLDAVRELRGQLDSLEEQCVRDALLRGASWEAIGSALGVSRQAAHRRLAARVTAGGRPGAASGVHGPRSLESS